MAEDADFQSLLARFRGGDRSAADELCRRFGPHIRVVVRRRLDRGLRVRFDSLDFVQDVWASFLTTPPDRYDFATPAALLGFLVRVARDKVADAARRPEARSGIGNNDAHPLIRNDEVLDELRSPDPTPCESAVAVEEWERILGRFPPGYRVILERLRDGYTHEDIAQMSEVCVNTVKRIVRRLKDMTGV
jgi:RNA polymerase sigma factor (sigma-70 family)